MPQTLPTTGFTQDTFDAFLAARNEPGWLTDLRLAAWKQFQRLPMPSRQDEEWMRTDIRLLRLDRFGLPSAGPTSDLPPGALSAGVELGGQITSLNSHTVHCRFADKWAEQGVLFGSLDELVASHGDLIKPHLLCRAVDPHYDKFAALHAACWTGGMLLYVPRNVVMDDPAYVLSVLEEGQVDLSHTLVVLEEGAQATLLCEQ